MAPNQLASHMNACKVKSDKCVECGEMIKRADKEEHKDGGICEAIKIAKESEGQQAAASNASAFLPHEEVKE